MITALACLTLAATFECRSSVCQGSIRVTATIIQSNAATVAWDDALLPGSRVLYATLTIDGVTQHATLLQADTARPFVITERVITTDDPEFWANAREKYHVALLYRRIDPPTPQQALAALQETNMGKGSKQRPRLAPRKDFEKSWERTFKQRQAEDKRMQRIARSLEKFPEPDSRYETVTRKWEDEQAGKKP